MPRRSRHCLPPPSPPPRHLDHPPPAPCNNIVAAVVNASSSSPRPLSSRLPPNLDRAGDNWRHRALYLGCARALPHLGTRTLSTGGHHGTARQRHRAAGELPLPLPPLPCCHRASCCGAAANDAALPPCCQAGHHRRDAATLPTALLPLMMQRCHRAAKLATATTLPLRFPLRCCR